MDKNSLMISLIRKNASGTSMVMKCAAVFCGFLSALFLMPIANSSSPYSAALKFNGVLQSVTHPNSQASTRVVSPILYVVNFTADWCPNCKVLDPALESALQILNDPEIEHVELDLTNPQRTNETFDKVNGTILAGVYGDYVGVTGLVVMIAADSGETIGCATRLVTAQAIALMIDDAKQKVRDVPYGARQVENLLCPPTNKKIPV